MTTLTDQQRADLANALQAANLSNGMYAPSPIGFDVPPALAHVYGQRPAPAPLAPPRPTFAARLLQVALIIVAFAAVTAAAAYVVLVVLPQIGWR